MSIQLFGNMDVPAPTSAEPPELGPPRVEKPNRQQVLLRPCSLEELLPAAHEVRTLWAVVERLDLSAFYTTLKCRGHNAGRSAKDPQLLVALWLWACTQGEGSARQVALLCEEHDSYRWLCGGVHVNHHTRSDFRTVHAAALDQLFTQVLALLVARNLVHVQRISQDGMRVRASAGAASFRREATLKEHLAQAQQHVQALKQELDAPARPTTRSRQQAARLRVAEQRAQRVASAIDELPAVQASKKRQEVKKGRNTTGEDTARVSTTDAEARTMKMGDGGFRPAYNVQLAADTQSRAIVAVDVSNVGSDQPLSTPLREQAEARTGQKVEEHLLDGGFVKLEAIEHAAQAEVKIYAPPMQRKGCPDPCVPRPDDSPAVRAWRERMATPEAKSIYKLRAATSETVNADLRCHRGLGQFLVRGMSKVRCIALWSALAYNIMHFGAQLLA